MFILQFWSFICMKKPSGILSDDLSWHVKAPILNSSLRHLRFSSRERHMFQPPTSAPLTASLHNPRAPSASDSDNAAQATTLPVAPSLNGCSIATYQTPPLPNHASGANTTADASDERILSTEIFILLAAAMRGLKNTGPTHEELKDMMRALRMSGAHTAKSIEDQDHCIQACSTFYFHPGFVEKVESATDFYGHCTQTLNIPTTTLRNMKMGSDWN